jgi:hypothetical protein
VVVDAAMPFGVLLAGCNTVIRPRHSVRAARRSATLAARAVDGVDQDNLEGS